MNILSKLGQFVNCSTEFSGITKHKKKPNPKKRHNYNDDTASEDEDDLDVLNQMKKNNASMEEYLRNLEQQSENEEENNDYEEEHECKFVVPKHHHCRPPENHHSENHNLEHLKELCKGEKGNKGESLCGEKGSKGDRGSVGEKGSHGPEGRQGVKGEKGDRGKKGHIGEKGEKGEIGIGIVGEKGRKGDMGDTGPKGEKGDNASNIILTQEFSFNNTTKLLEDNGNTVDMITNECSSSPQLWLSQFLGFGLSDGDSVFKVVNENTYLISLITSNSPICYSYDNQFVLNNEHSFINFTTNDIILVKYTEPSENIPVWYTGMRVTPNQQSCMPNMGQYKIHNTKENGVDYIYAYGNINANQNCGEFVISYFYGDNQSNQTIYPETHHIPNSTTLYQTVFWFCKINATTGSILWTNHYLLSNTETLTLSNLNLYLSHNKYESNPNIYLSINGIPANSDLVCITNSHPTSCTTDVVHFENLSSIVVSFTNRGVCLWKSDPLLLGLSNCYQNNGKLKFGRFGIYVSLTHVSSSQYDYMVYLLSSTTGETINTITTENTKYSHFTVLPSHLSCVTQTDNLYFSGKYDGTESSSPLSVFGSEFNDPTEEYYEDCNSSEPTVRIIKEYMYVAQVTFTATNTYNTQFISCIYSDNNNQEINGFMVYNGSVHLTGLFTGKNLKFVSKDYVNDLVVANNSLSFTDYGENTEKTFVIKLGKRTTDIIEWVRIIYGCVNIPLHLSVVNGGQVHVVGNLNGSFSSLHIENSSSTHVTIKPTTQKALYLVNYDKDGNLLTNKIIENNSEMDMTVFPVIDENHISLLCTNLFQNRLTITHSNSELIYTEKKYLNHFSDIITLIVIKGGDQTPVALQLKQPDYLQTTECVNKEIIYIHSECPTPMNILLEEPILISGRETDIITLSNPSQSLRLIGYKNKWVFLQQND